MVELDALHAALTTMRDEARTGRVSFFHFDDAQKMYSGSIFVEDGVTCYVHLRDLDPEAALAEIPTLHFAKVSTIPSTHADHTSDVRGLPMNVVLTRLDPALRPKPTPAPAPAAPAPAAPVAPKPAQAFYSHVAMRNDAVALLEPLFGVGAEKKVDEFARKSPPHQYPLDFLGKCKQHAAMMVGMRKADELFQPIYDRLAHH